MKISTLALTALITLSTTAQAQTQKPVTIKETPKAIKKPKQKPKPAQPIKAIASKDSVRAINKDPDHYYCPPCGRG